MVENQVVRFRNTTIMNSNRTWGIVAALLALFLVIAGLWGFRLNNEKTDLTSANAELETQFNDMLSLKEELEVEVDSMSVAFEDLSVENETLIKELKDEKSRVSRRNVKIKGLRSDLKSTQDNAAGEIASLKNQIQDLINTKFALQENITSLVYQNDSLKGVTGILESDLRIAKDENIMLNNLNNTIQKEVSNLTLANFKASAFRVEVAKKKATKVTSKGRRAKNIQVSFDLTNVPEKYQGVRPIYLVITDDKATPVKLDNPIKAQVSVNGQKQDILAAEAKETNIVDNQRLSFNHKLGDKLQSGFYRVAVYTDLGLLGASSFRLR